jgi:predicted nucleic acid-binding protein
LPRALVDTGPLVALVDASEPRHQDCIRVIRAETDPLLTVWPVLTEAMYLLRGVPRGQESVLDMIESGSVELAALGRDDVPRIRALMWKYRDQPMDLADGALVRVAEREGITRIITLDRRDFGVYRPGRSGRFEVMP